MAEDHRLFVSADRKVLVRMYDSGHVEAAVRPDTDHIWSPPIELREEK
jgi:hypothetical protein